MSTRRAGPSSTPGVCHRSLPPSVYALAEPSSPGAITAWSVASGAPASRLASSTDQSLRPASRSNAASSPRSVPQIASVRRPSLASTGAWSSGAESGVRQRGARALASTRSSAGALVAISAPSGRGSAGVAARAPSASLARGAPSRAARTIRRSSRVASQTCSPPSHAADSTGSEIERRQRSASPAAPGARSYSAMRPSRSTTTAPAGAAARLWPDAKSLAMRRSFSSPPSSRTRKASVAPGTLAQTISPAELGCGRAACASAPTSTSQRSRGAAGSASSSARVASAARRGNVASIQRARESHARVRCRSARRCTLRTFVLRAGAERADCIGVRPGQLDPRCGTRRILCVWRSADGAGSSFARRATNGHSRAREARPCPGSTRSRSPS